MDRVFKWYLLLLHYRVEHLLIGNNAPSLTDALEALVNCSEVSAEV